MSNYLTLVRAVYSGISQRQVAKSHQVSRNTIALVLQHAQKRGWLTLASLASISEEEFCCDFHLAKANEQEQFIKFKRQIAKIPLLIIDEWLLFPITEEETQMLLSIIDRRATTCSTIVVSQFEPAEWSDQIPIPVAAEAITDRIDAQSYHIVIQGKNSMRSKLS